jgi:hypothetical protein
MAWTPQSAQNDGKSDANTGKKADTTGKSQDYINSYNQGYGKKD